MVKVGKATEFVNTCKKRVEMGLDWIGKGMKSGRELKINIMLRLEQDQQIKLQDEEVESEKRISIVQNLRGVDVKGNNDFQVCCSHF